MSEGLADNNSHPPANEPVKPLVGRRGFLQGMLAVGGGTVGLSMLAACSSSSKSTSSTGSSAGTSAAGATSAAGSSGSTKGSQTLTLMLASWVDPAFISEVMQKTAADPLGVKLKLVTVDDGTYPAQASAAEKAGKAPDLIFWTAQGIPALQAAGVTLASLKDRAATETQSDFYKQDYQASTIKGDLYGLGFRCDCRGLAYRADYAEAAGLTTPDSWTLDEFGQWAAKMNSGSKQVGFGYEAKVGDGRSSSNFLPLIWSTGTDFVTQDSKGKWAIGYTAAQMEQVLQFYSDTVHKYKSTPSDVANWGYQETDGNFSKGSLASYSTGPFVLGNAAKYPKTLENLRITALPHITTPTNFWEEHTLMIHGKSKNQDLAWKFVEAMRNEETQTAIASRVTDYQLSVRPAVNAGITNAGLKSFGALLQTAKVPEAINVAPIMNGAVLPAIESLALSNVSAADATKKLMTNMQSALDQINQS